MSPYLPMLAYCGAVALAIGLLYTFESRRWYWHALSLALAFAIGFAPTRAGSDNPVADLITGFPIIFLLFWGLGGLLLGTLPHRTKHA
jgi:hypothetical protein